MTQNVQKILDSVLELPDEEQLELLSALSIAVDERGLRPFDDSWLAEIQRRSDEYDAGQVTTCSWEEVKARARQEIARRAQN